MRIPLSVYAVTIAALAACSCRAQSAPATGQGAATPKSSVYDLEFQANKAYDDKHYADSIRLFDDAFSRGLNRNDDAYSAACSAALAGDRAKAIRYLQIAVKLGFHDPGHIKADTDLESIRNDPAFSSIIETAAANDRTYNQQHADPDHAAIITTDIALFWTAYDHLKGAPDRPAIIEREYFARRSPGLQDFIFARIHSASGLVQTIDKAPKYYENLRPASMRIQDMVPAIHASFRKLKDLYTPAIFPDVYFLIGRMNSGGTTGPAGLLLGADMFGKQPGVSLDELSEWHRSVVGPVDTIPAIVAHELIHYQQHGEGKTLLAQALNEGSADFVGQMISSGNINAAMYQYGMQHEAELWSDFQKEMNGEDTSHWLYQGKSENGRPADLAYFMGYRISQAYYQKAQDKKKALADILNFADATALLRASGYAEQSKSIP